MRKFAGLISKRKLPQNGDTIIEVMVCIAVMGLAIGTGYALTNRSFRYGLSSAERSQAQALAQGQAEFIKDAYLTRSSSPASLDQMTLYKTKGQTSTGFCILTASGSDGANPGTALDPSDPACTIDSLFNLRITYDNSVNSFAIKTTWDSGTGSNKNQTTLYYKVP